MAAAASESCKLDVDFECPVCHDEYVQPKFLPCMHVICRKCIVSWLTANGQGGCPLCRAPILPSTQSKSADLGAAVDTLQTDLATKALIESHHALSGDKVCSVCDDVNATSYCLQCSVKLCKSCSKAHGRFPAFREHVLENLTSLTPQRLAATHSTPCDLHADKMADLYCLDHKKVICLVCSTTHHRACSGVGTVGDVAVQARGELQQQAQRLRSREADVDGKVKQLDQEMRDILTHFNNCQTEVKATFHGMRRQLDKREQEITAQLQKHRDDVISSKQAEKSALERQKASIAAHAGSVERLIVPSPDSAVLGMLEKLKARLDDLETQQQQTPGGAGKTTLKSVVFDKDVVACLQREIGALGQVTLVRQKAVPPAVTPAAVQSVKKHPQVSGDNKVIITLGQKKTPTAVKTVTPIPLGRVQGQTARKTLQATSGGGKATGVVLARVLKVGDRVKRGAGWISGDEGAGGPGTVIAVPSEILRDMGDDPTDVVDVRWDNGRAWWHYMGHNNCYELELA